MYEKLIHLINSDHQVRPPALHVQAVQLILRAIYGYHWKELEVMSRSEMFRSRMGAKTEIYMVLFSRKNV